MFQIITVSKQAGEKRNIKMKLLVLAVKKIREDFVV
jgi:hypothetical protein